MSTTWKNRWKIETNPFELIPWNYFLSITKYGTFKVSTIEFYPGLLIRFLNFV